MEPVHVLFCVDEAYALHVATVAKSILDNTRCPVEFHIIHDRIRADTINRITAFLSARAQFRWYPAEEADILKLDGPLHYISRTTYLRLTADYKLPLQVERVIYLDVDTIVFDDIGKLWRYSMSGYPLAATSNPGVDPCCFAERFALTKPKEYFNAGVVLMNLKLIRKLDLLANTRELAVSHDYEYGDQDAMNIGFWNNWIDFGDQWNFQRKSLYLRNMPPNWPYIIHFSDEQKPWRRTDWHPYAWQYLRVLNQTPFAKEIREAGGLTWGVGLYWYMRWLRHLVKRKLSFRGGHTAVEHGGFYPDQRPIKREVCTSDLQTLGNLPTPQGMRGDPHE